MKNKSNSFFQLRFGRLRFWVVFCSVAILLSCAGDEDKEEEAEDNPAATVAKPESNSSSTYTRKVTRTDLTEDEKKILELIEGGLTLTGDVVATNIPDQYHVTITNVKLVAGESTLALQSALPFSVNTAIVPLRLSTTTQNPNQLAEGKQIIMPLAIETLTDLRFQKDVLVMAANGTSIEPATGTGDNTGGAFRFCPIAAVALSGESIPCKEVTVGKTESGAKVSSQDVMCPLPPKSGSALTATGGCSRDAGQATGKPGGTKTCLETKPSDCFRSEIVCDTNTGKWKCSDSSSTSGESKSCVRPKGQCPTGPLVLEGEFPNCIWSCPDANGNPYLDPTCGPPLAYSIDENGKIIGPALVTAHDRECANQAGRGMFSTNDMVGLNPTGQDQDCSFGFEVMAYFKTPTGCVTKTNSCEAEKFKKGNPTATSVSSCPTAEEPD